MDLIDVKRSLSFVWAKESDLKETYEFDLSGDTSWACTRKDASCQMKSFRLSYNQESGRLWWGQSYFLDPSDLMSKPERAMWHRASDTVKRKAA